MNKCISFIEWKESLNSDIQEERLIEVGCTDEEIKKIHEEEYKKYISNLKHE